MNIKTKSRTKKLLILITVILVLTSLPIISSARIDSPEKNVRVGYFTMENFMQGGSDGSAKSGFTYELLCEIAAYNHWNIEYVYGDFGDLYKQLEEGTIDILPNIIDTEERKQQVLFHSLALNTEHYYISALRDKVSDEVQPAALNGKKLATVKDAFEEKYFDEWALKNGVSMEKVYCSGFDEAWEIVRSGKADFILNINNTAPDPSFSPLFEVGKHGVYFGVAKNREDIIDDMDFAMKMIDDVSPFLFSELQKKYLNESLTSYRMSREEEKWIESHSVLRIGGLKNDVPYAYEDENGTVVGTYVDLTNLILEKLSINTLTVEWSLYDSMDELRTALKNNELDLICPEYHSYSEADHNGLSISETIMEIPMGILSLPSVGIDGIKTIATGGTRPGFVYVQENYHGAEIVSYDTVDELVRAVSKGEADAAIAHIYALQESIRNNKTDFVLSPLSMPCIICYASLEENHELIMLMNRGYHLIDQNELSSMDVRYAAGKTNLETAKDFFRENMMIIIFLLFLILAIIAFAINRAIISGKLKKNLDEITRQNAIIEASRQELEIAQKTLKERNVYLEYFLKSFNSAYIVDLKNDSFEILYMNHEFQNVFTMEGDKKAMDDFIENHIHPEDRDLMKKMSDSSDVMHLLEKESELSFTVREVFGDIVKTMRVFIVRGVDNAGATVAFMDISDEIEKEKEYSRKLEAANRAKSTFLFNMSHDIRTPMNAILGYTDVAIKHCDDQARVNDSLEKIKLAGGHLLNLINDILEMSRIESDKLEISNEPTDIRSLIKGVDQMSGSLAIPKSVFFKTEVGNIENPYVYIDEVHTNEILINLTSNAIKYTPAGGKVNFRVNQTAPVTDGKTVFRFDVEDDGIGMSEEFQQHIFEAFSREKTSTVSKQQGAGIGLSIVKKIVDLSGGSISVNSRQNEGSTFTVELPVRVMDEEAIRKFEEDNKPLDIIENEFSLEKRKVLLVEDNEMNREIATEILEEAGLIVDIAEDGEFAVKAVEEKGMDYFDFILMDIQMPVMDGYEATKVIRGLPGGDKVKIIALSANAFEEDIQKSLSIGMNAHVAKPIDVNILFETMRDLT